MRTQCVSLLGEHVADYIGYGSTAPRVSRTSFCPRYHPQWEGGNRHLSHHHMLFKPLRMQCSSLVLGDEWAALPAAIWSYANSTEHAQMVAGYAVYHTVCLLSGTTALLVDPYIYPSRMGVMSSRRSRTASPRSVSCAFRDDARPCSSRRPSFSLSTWLSLSRLLCLRLPSLVVSSSGPSKPVPSALVLLLRASIQSLLSRYVASRLGDSFR